ncbi:hypothetical protein WKW79_03490 [Variovorax robiniae]|uniref:Uncharacterized protein n=1 Tax=Variovorax robiniae TaxID=1836199 RepID=A0ABU8X3L7_9BURK
MIASDGPIVVMMVRRSLPMKQCVLRLGLNAEDGWKVGAREHVADHEYEQHRDNDGVSADARARQHGGAHRMILDPAKRNEKTREECLQGLARRYFRSRESWELPSHSHSCWQCTPGAAAREKIVVARAKPVRS